MNNNLQTSEYGNAILDEIQTLYVLRNNIEKEIYAIQRSIHFGTIDKTFLGGEFEGTINEDELQLLRKEQIIMNVVRIIQERLRHSDFNYYIHYCNIVKSEVQYIKYDGQYIYFDMGTPRGKIDPHAFNIHNNFNGYYQRCTEIIISSTENEEVKAFLSEILKLEDY